MVSRGYSYDWLCWLHYISPILNRAINYRQSSSMYNARIRPDLLYLYFKTWAIRLHGMNDENRCHEAIE